MAFLKVGFLFAIILVILLICHSYAANTKNLDVLGSNWYNISKNIKPNVQISDFNGTAAISNNSQYDLMYSFSYVVHDGSIIPVQSFTTNVYTLDGNDIENVQYFVDGHSRASPLIFNYSPGGTYNVTGIDYVKKLHVWRSPGAWEKLWAKVVSKNTTLDEKFVKLTLP